MRVAAVLQTMTKIRQGSNLSQATGQTSTQEVGIETRAEAIADRDQEVLSKFNKGNH